MFKPSTKDARRPYTEIGIQSISVMGGILWDYEPTAIGIAQPRYLPSPIGVASPLEQS